MSPAGALVHSAEATQQAVNTTPDDVEVLAESAAVRASRQQKELREQQALALMRTLQGSVGDERAAE